jgi:DNA-directed RNA polymerase I subunit RPA12
MSLVGTLLFCTACGNLLDYAPSETETIVCKICDATNTSTNHLGPDRSSLTVSVDNWPTSIQRTSKPNGFPSNLQRKRRNIQIIDWDEIETWVMTHQACTQCGNPEMYSTSMQLRGADEGSTNFYRCPKCGFRYSSLKSLNRTIANNLKV